MKIGGIRMKRILVAALLALSFLCLFAGVAGAAPLPEDMSGYYKFGYLDGNTYSVRVEMGSGTINVYILPFNDLYIGTIVDEKIYFSSDDGQSGWGELRQINENASLVTTHDMNTGQTKEFSVIKITQEEANQIAESNQVIRNNSQCALNLSRIYTALGQFARDHGGEMPYGISEIYPQYIADKKVFVCPARGGEFHDFDADYEYIPGFRTDSPNPDQEPLLIEIQGNHMAPWKFHYVLYLNGRSKWIRD
jgi:hypothetical protein